MIWKKDLTFKGTVAQDFWLQVFLWIIFPQAPENNNRVILNFLQKFAEIFASQGAPLVSPTLEAYFTTSNSWCLHFFSYVFILSYLMC
jgi:hypothetical protein